MSLVRTVGKWNVLYDQNHKREYYQNTDTGKTQWERPPELDKPKIEIKLQTSSTMPTNKPYLSVAGWDCYHDPNQKKDYYAKVGQPSVWQCPPEILAKVTAHKKKLGSHRRSLSQPVHMHSESLLKSLNSTTTTTTTAH